MPRINQRTVENSNGLSPEHIRAIREKLQLSQAEAGEVIGGGPRAFTKYEAGAVKPSAAIIKLLKILEDNPGALEMLTGKKLEAGARGGRSPFEVNGKHIEELTATQLVHLTRRLLAAEAFFHAIPAAKIHAPENINAPDGGEDARIEWDGGPTSTRYLRCRLNQFQMKSGKINANAAGKEVLDKKGNIKKMVRSVLEAKGVYTLLCAHGYTQPEIQKKERTIQEALEGAGLQVKGNQISFYDSSMIAEWVNAHPSVAVWILEQTEMGSIGKFRSWEYWKSSPEHKVDLIGDPRLAKVQEELLPAVSNPNTVRRVIGPSGTGKSRLVLESLRVQDESAAINLPQISDLVLYVDEQIAGNNAVKLALQNLTDSSTRAVVVVDRCSIETHRDLANLVKRSESKLSLVTIDDEPPFAEKDETILIKPADKDVIEGIFKLVAPNLPSEDHRRLVKFSQGFPKIATLLGESWARDIPVANTPEDIAKAIIVGREQSEPDLLLRGAEVLSVFGIVYDNEIEVVSKLARRVSLEDLRWVIKKLENRGIIQRKGKAFVMQPRPVALCLAELMWFEWGENRWDNIIFGALPHNIRVRAIEQLALLNTTELGVQIGQHLLRRSGPLDSIESLSQTGCAKIFSNLSEIDTYAAISLLERLLNGLSPKELKNIDGEIRRHIICSLDKICFRADTFERGAKIMLNLAVAENEGWGNNATGQFKSFFPVHLGDTAAEAGKRLRVIDDALDTENEVQLLIVIEALLAGAELNHFTRSVGSESHGSRPALEPWEPKTWGDLWKYIENCCDHLIELAKRKDTVGTAAKKGLGYKFRSLANKGLLHVAEKAVREITAIHSNYWPEAYESLSHVFEYDIESLDEDTDKKIQSLIEILQPDSLEDRVRILLTEMPWDYPCELKMSFSEKEEKQRKTVEDFTIELLDSPDELKKVIPMTCTYAEDGRKAQHRKTPLFGEYLAIHSKNPIEWLDTITSALKEIEPENRDLNFLSGFLSGLNDSHPDVVEKFKQEAVASSNFAPALPSICSHIDIQPDDIPLVIEGIKNGLIEPWHLWQWSCGGVLAKSLSPFQLSPLLDFLIHMGSDGFCLGLELIGMYAHGRYEILNKLMPQIKLAAEKADTKDKHDRGYKMNELHFQDIMKWVLNKGRDDPSASSIALILSRQLIKLVEDDNEDLINPLVSQLLSDFPEISWPLIGQAIVSDRKTAWRLEYLLGDIYSFRGTQNPPLLSLPEDTLFSWCHANQEVAPAFVAVVVPILTSQNPDEAVRTLHPIVRRLLDEFGDRKDVLDGISRNIGTYGWSGSRTTYYELYERPLKDLEDHTIKQVRFWAQKMVHHLGLQKSAAHDEDEEQEAHWSV